MKNVNYKNFIIKYLFIILLTFSYYIIINIKLNKKKNKNKFFSLLYIFYIT